MSLQRRLSLSSSRGFGTLFPMEDTISAICTPPGEGGLAVLRISGPCALEVANKIFTGNVLSYTSHTAHLGKILSKKGAVIDEVLLLVMKAGRSYTGEETVEIMCHGSPLIAQKILARTFEEGSIAAGPGAFTAKAYQNGMIDLAQAEAVQALIGAKNESALQAAADQLGGRLSIVIKDLQKSICDVTAIIEAWVDYPEEGLEFATKDEIVDMIDVILAKGEKLRDTFHDGKRLVNGISICLAGAPNAGKSSLMNILLESDRAIVTEVAGTTRDVLTEDVRIAGHAIKLFDTAGLRETEDVIEKEGIKRARGVAANAEIVIAIYDVTKPITEIGYEDAIVCLNKIDLPHDVPPISGIEISCSSGDGIENLKEAIAKRIESLTKRSDDDVILTQERHFADLTEMLEMMVVAKKNLLSDESPEFIVLDLRAALKALSRIIGIDITEEVLGSIFEKFCVGK